MRHWTVLCAAMVIAWGLNQSAVAQELVVTNARVIVGNGHVIDNGTIVVRRGRIITVGEEHPGEPDLPVVDVGGLTVLPGFIDGHRRLIRGDPDAWLESADDHMRAYLDAGFTSALSVDDAPEHMLELRDRLELGLIEGPRVFMSGSVAIVSEDGRSVRSPGEIRDAVEDLTNMGADGLTTVVRAASGEVQEAGLSVLRDEADELGLPLIAHVESVEDAVAAIAGGSGYLSRTPYIGELDQSTAGSMVESGRYNAEYGLVVTSALTGAAQATAVTNARMLRDAGAIYGFGTGTGLPPDEALRAEVAVLGSIFSNEEVIDILTRSAAFSMRRDDALGTLIPGRIADMVMVDGDPLTDLDALFEVRMVIRSGRIVVDDR